MIRDVARRGLPRVSWLAVASAAISGCFLWTTRDDGDRLARENRDQEERLTALEQGFQGEREKIREGMSRAEAQVTKLESVIEQARQVVTRNSADMGEEVAAMQAQLGRLEGQIAELRNAFETIRTALTQQQAQIDQKVLNIARATGIDPPIGEGDIPTDPAEHFASATRAYQGNDFARSRSLFREFVRRHPTDERAGAAQYWVGAAYLAQSQPARALGEFHKVLEGYPSSDAVDDTLLDLAEAFWQMHACSDARAALEALIQNHADSRLVPRARAKMREIRQAPRNACSS